MSICSPVLSGTETRSRAGITAVVGRSRSCLGAIFAWKASTLLISCCEQYFLLQVHVITQKNSTLKEKAKSFTLCENNRSESKSLFKTS